MAYGGNGSSGPVYLIRNGAQPVPADYVGMHFRAWPLFDSAYWSTASQRFPSAPSAAPVNMAYGNYRSHDSVYSWWYRVETTKGVYNWVSLDTLVTTHKASGKTVNFCMYGVPNWYLADGNPQKGGANSRSCYPDAPDGIVGLNAFITALVTRYNTEGGGWATQPNGAGTNWSVLGKGIQYLELWNEPEFGSPDGFWIGTAGQFIDLAYNIRTSAKAVDSTLPILSPGFSGTNHLQTFLQATGTINTVVSGLAVVDAVCLHIYTTTPAGFKFGSWQAAGYEILNLHRGLQSVLTTTGATAKPVYITETGIDYTANTAELQIVNAQPPSWRYAWWARMMMMGAALGYRVWGTYAWDTPYVCNPDSDPDGVAKAVNAVHINVAGKTIRDAWYYSGGEVGMRFSDGSTFVV